MKNGDSDKLSNFKRRPPFSSERNEWMQSKCINIHDYQSPFYELAKKYDGRRAAPKNFFMLMESYQNHPEAKSLGPDGKQCEFDTQGLVKRAHIVANWPLAYRRKGKAVADDGQLARIAKVSKREFMRRGVNQHTLEKICKREPPRAI
jgi:hypothetical protein